MGKLRAHMKDQKGVVFILVAVALLVFIAFAALALDVGNALVVRNELQNIADAAALAGARTLGRLYECNGNITTCTGAMLYQNQLTYQADAGAIKNAINDVASKNQAGGKTGITINDADIVIGNWDAATKTLSATLISPDAVSVKARRDASANSPITTFFAGLLGINTLNVSAPATAALTGQSTTLTGGLPIPMAINKTWLTTLPCNQNLQLHPSSAQVCAAWHAYDGNVYQPNGNGLDNLVQALTAGTYSSPTTTAGQTQYDFTNGTVAKIFQGDFQALFNTMRVKNDGIVDLDNNPNTWTTAVAVFDDAAVGCSPNKMITIVGFATIVITSVAGPPGNTVFGAVQCDIVESGRGSGSNLGTKGSIPGLVQ
jgi:hypothetical protein